MRSPATVAKVLFALTACLFLGCGKDEETPVEEVPAPAPPPEDYRIAFCDSFRFTVVQHYWFILSGASVDTLTRDGEVRLYVPLDSDLDMYGGDDSGEDPDQKVTIDFRPEMWVNLWVSGSWITSLIEEDGTLVDKEAWATIAIVAASRILTPCASTWAALTVQVTTSAIR